ncbi:MAG TPA: DedA family protein [Solirubrobacteraceae bacterium]|nr:DedA family protein [Solirubrobacteraceae bacterium]
MPLLVASLTGPLVNLATHIIRSLGLAGVLALVAMSGVVGVPGTEPTMLFAGFNVFQGHLSLLGIIVFGVVGDVIGASIAYAIGYFGSQELLERHGAKLHLRQSGLDRAHRWFERRGTPVVFVSRLIPFVRAAFPYAAGVARMSYLRFIAFAALGSVVWITALGVLGKAVGDQWQTWRHHLEYADYAAIGVLVLAIAYLVVRRRRGGSADGEPSVEAAGTRDASMDAVSP